jgi:peptidoglycan pentaglycine glycine transferase (the first glycine)
MAEWANIRLVENVDTNAQQVQLKILGDEQRVIWDTFIATAPHGHLLQSWNWGELKASFGWRPLRVGLLDVDQQRLLAGAQILCRSIPFTPLSIAYVPKGPVIDWSDPVLCQRFLQALHPLLRARHVALLRVDPDLPESIALPAAESSEDVDTVSPGIGDADDSDVHFGALYSIIEGSRVVQQLSTLGFRTAEDSIQPRRTIAVDLTPDEHTIALRQRPKWRYNAGLAARKGVTVRTATNLKDLQRWYELMQITSQRDRFAIHTFAYYQRAWELFGGANQAQLLLAEYEGNLLAGIFVTLIGREGIYLYGASGNEGRNLMPNHLLQWEAMRWAKAHGATLYDLWGIADSEDPSDPMAGVYRFKRGWGGKMIRYIGSFDYVYAPITYRTMALGRNLQKRLAAARVHRRTGVTKPEHVSKGR